MPPKEKPGLSKAELEIARLLWELGEATVRQVFERLPKGRGIDFVTVQTFLRRLEAKGYATGRLEGRVRHYRAKVQPKTVIRKTVDDLVERLFGGATMPLVRHLIEDKGVDAAAIADLRQLLDKMEKEAKEGGNNDSQ